MRDEKFEAVPILGVPISVVDMKLAVDRIAGWVAARRSCYVCAPDVHGVMRAQDLPRQMRAYRGAAMVTPDGKPLEWVGRIRGRKDIARVSGPDLMLEVCKRSVAEGWRHYFFGGAEGVAEEMAKRLSARIPGLQIAGIECPPFRPLTPEEEAASIRRINESGANIVWVGLGAPKQEMWMLDNVAKIDAAVLVGVGAAFDFHSGKVKRAPLWMRNNGFEWLHRLLSEPRRLWWRYLVLAPRFVWRAAAEEVRLRTGRQATSPAGAG